MLLTVKRQKYKNILKIFYLWTEHTQFAQRSSLGNIYMYTYVYINRPRRTERRAMFLTLRGSECCRMKARQSMKQTDDNKQETGTGKESVV